MYVLSLLSLALIPLAGNHYVIDNFRYTSVDAARKAWIAGEGATPVDLVKSGGQTALKLSAPFASTPDLKRVVLDRPVHLDLTEAGGISLELAFDNPDNVGDLALYFRSGDGWYVAGRRLVKQGWQTVRFSKAQFQTEHTPTGWQKIEAIRIALQPVPGTDTANMTLHLRRLAAVSQEVTVVLPTKGASPDSDSARQYGQPLVKILADLGFDADTIDEKDLAAGALTSRRRVAILPCNPTLSSNNAEILARFVEAGGKLLVCFHLDPKLGRALGFSETAYVAPERARQFAEMRFDANDVKGLPASMRQDSWNINSAKPVEHNARVIGFWHDSKGESTGHPAVLLSDRGAFVTHLVRADDYEGKQRLVASLLGHLAPSLWRPIAETRLEQAANVGHCLGLDNVVAFLKSSSLINPDDVERARQLLKNAKEQFAQREYPQAIDTAMAAHELLVQAYLRAEPSPKREGRAVWEHYGTGAYPGDWERSAKLLAENGFNMIITNMLWGGLAHYPSDVLPRSDVFRKHGDQIEQCCAAAKKYGLEVHVWKCDYQLSSAPKEFSEQMRAEGRIQVNINSVPNKDWLCPSHPENQKLELDSMLEVARRYPVDGLHFDYIRYPCDAHCYCDGCRQRFESESGKKVSDWPRECYSGSRKEEYNKWRCQQITSLVAAVRREARKIRPDIKLSAAVFGEYPWSLQIAQDWPEWIREGYLDFVCPMNYTTDDADHRAKLHNQLGLVGGRVPIYSGIGAFRLPSADRVIGQIHDARALGAGGFVFFHFHAGAASTISTLGLGVGSQPAVTAHKSKAP